MYAPPSPARVDCEAPIRVADWIELNLLTAEEPVLSVTGVTQVVAGEPPDDSADSEHRNDYSEDAEDANPAQQQEGFWQLANNTAEMAFKELLTRSASFSDRYPIVSNGESAETNKSYDSPRIAAFLTLLRSRHLYADALGDDGSIAGELFEELLQYALRRYIDTTDSCSVHFGLAGGSRGGGLPSNAKEALDELASRMNEEKGTLESLAQNRDFGVDAIAWRPFPDYEPGQLAVVGQATIAEGKWVSKFPSPKWDTRRLIGFLARPAIAIGFVETITLSEQRLLRAKGEPDFVSIPLDRLRLLFVLRDSDIPESLLERITDWCDGMKERLRQ